MMEMLREKKSICLENVHYKFEILKFSLFLCFSFFVNGVYYSIESYYVCTYKYIIYYTLVLGNVYARSGTDDGAKKNVGS